MHSFRKTGLGLATSALALLAGTAAHAQISGFGDGSNFQHQRGDCCTDFTPKYTNGGNTLEIGGNFGDGYESATLFDKTPQPFAGSGFAGFTASFTFTASEQNTNGTGFAFVVQNDSRGASAHGSTNNAFGYGSNGYAGSFVGPSDAAYFNLKTGGVGLDAAHSPGSGTTPGLISINTGAAPVTVNLTYSGLTTTLTETLTQGANVFVLPAQVIDLASTLGSPTAYVGFANSNNADYSDYFISNFSFTPTAVIAPEPSQTAALGLGVLGLSGLALAARRRRVNG